jgi:hypothetical protein
MDNAMLQNLLFMNQQGNNNNNNISNTMNNNQDFGAMNMNNMMMGGGGGNNNLQNFQQQFSQPQQQQQQPPQSDSVSSSSNEKLLMQLLQLQQKRQQLQNELNTNNIGGNNRGINSSSNGGQSINNLANNNSGVSMFNNFGGLGNLNEPDLTPSTMMGHQQPGQNQQGWPNSTTNYNASSSSKNASFDHLAHALFNSGGTSQLASLNPDPIKTTNFSANSSNINRVSASTVASNQSNANISAPSPNDGWAGGDLDKPAPAVVAEDPYAQNGVVGPWSAFSASLLGDMALTSENGNAKNGLKNAAANKPKRPLSAYNVFFKEERNRILDTIPDSEAKQPSKSTRKRKKRPHGKIGFESLAKAIGKRWQSLTPDELSVYKGKAQEDMQRYKAEMDVYVVSEAKRKRALAAAASLEKKTSISGVSGVDLGSFADDFFEPSDAKKARMTPGMFQL